MNEKETSKKSSAEMKKGLNDKSPPKGIAFRNKSRKNMKSLSLTISPSDNSRLPPRHPFIPIEKEMDDAANNILHLFGNKPGNMSIDIIAFKNIDFILDLSEKKLITREELQQIIDKSNPVGNKLFHKQLLKIILSLELHMMDKETNSSKNKSINIA